MLGWYQKSNIEQTSVDTRASIATGCPNKKIDPARKEKGKTNEQNGTKDLRECWQLTATCARPPDARITTDASLAHWCAFFLRSTSSYLAHTSGSPLDP